MKQIKSKIKEKPDEILNQIKKKTSKNLTRIKNNKELISFFSKLKKNSEKKVLLQNGSDEFIKALLEILLNVMNGNVQISNKVKKSLKKYKKVLRRLLCPNVSLKSKRRALIQTGGFLTTLLPIVIGGVLDFIFKQKKE